MFNLFLQLATIKVLQPGEVCTDSYLVAFASLSEVKTKNFAKYACTKFFRFLLLQATSSINLSKDKFQFIPMIDLSQSWSDERLYDQFELDESELQFIEGMMKEKEMV